MAIVRYVFPIILSTTKLPRCVQQAMCIVSGELHTLKKYPKYAFRKIFNLSLSTGASATRSFSLENSFSSWPQSTGCLLRPGAPIDRGSNHRRKSFTVRGAGWFKESIWLSSISALSSRFLLTTTPSCSLDTTYDIV